MTKGDPTTAEKQRPSYNLVGQRLGRKGRDTRERILTATERLLAGTPDTAISLSAVAREASLAMTTLYLYFGDLTELLLAVLEPIMASAEDSYVGQLRTLWPDEELGECCRKFVRDYHSFWVQHTRILHLRNALADNNDERMRECRVSSAQPLIDLFIVQMESDRRSMHTPAFDMATVLMTSLERIVTVTTDVSFPGLILDEHLAEHVQDLLRAEARLLELGIRDGRELSRAARRS